LMNTNAKTFCIGLQAGGFGGRTARAEQTVAA
jgi:hypothetical protein